MVVNAGSMVGVCMITEGSPVITFGSGSFSSGSSNSHETKKIAPIITRINKYLEVV